MDICKIIHLHINRYVPGNICYDLQLKGAACQSRVQLFNIRESEILDSLFDNISKISRFIKEGVQVIR